jgi:hypothetical protein
MAENETRECPFCKEEVHAEATKCKHCRSTLTPARPSHHGICPFCKEEIKLEALKCKHCGSMLTAHAEQRDFGATRGRAPAILRMMKDPFREQAIAACRNRCHGDLVDFLDWCNEHFPNDRKGRLACKNAAYDEYHDCDGGCGGATALSVGGATALTDDLLAWW